MSTPRMFQIGRIILEKDRVLLCPHKLGKFVWAKYFVIASHEQAKGLVVGDTIVYELGVEGFGWFVEKTG